MEIYTKLLNFWNWFTELTLIKQLMVASDYLGLAGLVILSPFKIWVWIKNWWNRKKNEKLLEIEQCVDFTHNLLKKIVESPIKGEQLSEIFGIRNLGTQLLGLETCILIHKNKRGRISATKHGKDFLRMLNNPCNRALFYKAVISSVLSNCNSIKVQNASDLPPIGIEILDEYYKIFIRKIGV